jgi:hypothetical protein
VTYRSTASAARHDPGWTTLLSRYGADRYAVLARRTRLRCLKAEVRALSSLIATAWRDPTSFVTVSNPPRRQ